MTSSLASSSVEAFVLTGGSSDYRQQHVLGEGCFGKVAQCLNLDTKEIVAVKVLKQRSQYALKAKQEVAMLNMVRSLDPDTCCIVGFYESFVYCGHTCLVFQKLDLSLHAYMRRRRLNPLSLSELRPIMQQLATALKALKGIGLIHTDLKLDNIMLVDQTNQPFRVKLIDFGLAVPASEIKRGTILQPLCYRAPEVLLGLPISEAIDMWALGCVMGQLYLGKHLFPAREAYATMRAILGRQGRPPSSLLDDGWWTRNYFVKEKTFRFWRLKLPSEYVSSTGERPRLVSRTELCCLDVLFHYEAKVDDECEKKDHQEFIDLLRKMLSLDAKLRITPAQALNHPFLSMINLIPKHLEDSYADDAMDIMTVILCNDKSLESEKKEEQTSMSPLQDSNGGEDKENDGNVGVHDEKEADILTIYDEGEENDKEEESLKKKTKRRETFKERMVKRMDSLKDGIMKRWDTLKDRMMTKRQTT